MQFLHDGLRRGVVWFLNHLHKTMEGHRQWNFHKLSDGRSRGRLLEVCFSRYERFLCIFEFKTNHKMRTLVILEGVKV